MAREYRFFGIKEANADIKASADAINPLLVSAKITTIQVNGKDTPATSDDVPTAMKILALAGVTKEGSGDQEISQMAANNSILAEQAKHFEVRAVTAETNAATVTRDKIALEGQLTVEKASVARLTAENSELITLRKAAATEAGRVTEQLNALNTELSRHCLAVGCLMDLRDSDNNLLVSTASPEAKQAAAERIPAADKLKAFSGAVSNAIRSTGVDITQLPAAGNTNGQLSLSAQSVLKQYNAIKGASERITFYRNNKAAIDAAYREQSS